MDILKADKGKNMIISFKAGQITQTGSTLFEKYPVPGLETGSKRITFSLNWDVHINNYVKILR